MCRHLRKTAGITKNQGNGTTEGTDLKEIEVHELPDKEFEIIVLKMLRELQENPNIQHIKRIVNHQVVFIPGIQE